MQGAKLSGTNIAEGGAETFAYVKLPERFAIQPHRATVSIIVTVHNALEYVRTCLSAIVRHTVPPYELVLVDDGSEPETSEYLRQFAAEQNALLIRNEAASGYTVAANQGLRAAHGEYLLLLNSDAIVTENWLDRMVMCAESDPSIGLVGPLSNRATWQSIPEVFEEDGNWAANDLPERWTAQDVARAVAAFTGRTYPRTGFLNGFCLLIKRRMLETVGHFDEESFGRGYGEETDYCFRAGAEGWLFGIADDAYVFHAGTRSYTIERRNQLCEEAYRVLLAKHGEALFARGIERNRNDLVMLGVRARTSQVFARQSLIEEGRRLWAGKRIAFVLPIGELCGEGNTVLAEAKAMEAFGASVLIVNLIANKAAFQAWYPELDLPVVFVATAADVPDAVRGYDAVVATTASSVFAVQSLAGEPGSPILGYYIQDFEPSLFPADSAEHRAALSSYALIPGLIRFTKTAWNRNEILSHAGVDCAMVGPSCDVDLFRPRVVPAPAKLRVCAMIRPSSPRWAARETMEVLGQLDRQYGDRVAIHLFGVNWTDALFLDLPMSFPWTNHGVQTREQMAALLCAQDIFIDLSHSPMGLAALEAMASGAAVVLSRTGCWDAFAVHGENALVVDFSNRIACLQAIGTLIEDAELLARIRRRAQCDVVRFWPEQAAFNILTALVLEADSKSSVSQPRVGCFDTDFNEEPGTPAPVELSTGKTVAGLVGLAGNESQRGRLEARRAVACLASERAPREPRPRRMLSIVAPGSPVKQNAPGSRQAEDYLALAEAQRMRGEDEAAVLNYQAALALKPNFPEAHLALAGLRMPGDDYRIWLERLYRSLAPETVIEIGVFQGETLALLRPPTVAIGVDPNPIVAYPLNTDTHIFPETSDEFFAQRRPERLLAGRPLSVGFIDGSHLYEQVLRDFIGLEAFCGPRSVLLIHDAVPLDEPTQRRTRATTFHTGDVWKALLCLKCYRPGLDIFTIATPPSGLTIVTGLDPTSLVLKDRYDEAVAEFQDTPFSAIEFTRETALNIVPNDWSLVESRLKERRVIS